MRKTYTDEEKRAILSELKITPADGMVMGGQVAKILTRRACLEEGVRHEYNSADIRRRVASGTITYKRVGSRLNLFSADEAFTLQLHPEKWHSRERIAKEKDPTKLVAKPIDITT